MATIINLEAKVMLTIKAFKCLEQIIHLKLNSEHHTD